MANSLAGFRVLEVAAWTFVPAAGAVLADWGADVIKVEHPVTGDPQRGLISMGLIPGGPAPSTTSSSSPTGASAASGSTSAPTAGADLLYQLVETSDVFLTSFLPAVRQRLKIDVEYIRAVNPNIVYARGTGPGAARARPRKGWVRRRHLLGPRVRWPTPSRRPTAEWPIGGRPAFGDLAGGMAIAGGIAAGLLQRATTERPLSSTSRCWGWPCGSCHPTSWPPVSTAAIPCRNSTGASPPTRWWATTGPATGGSSRS